MSAALVSCIMAVEVKPSFPIRMLRHIKKRITSGFKTRTRRSVQRQPNLAADESAVDLRQTHSGECKSTGNDDVTDLRGRPRLLPQEFHDQGSFDYGFIHAFWSSHLMMFLGRDFYDKHLEFYQVLRQVLLLHSRSVFGDGGGMPQDVNLYAKQQLAGYGLHWNTIDHGRHDDVYKQFQRS